MRQRILGFGTWCAALLLGTAVFHALGDGNLAPPPLAPSAWGPWVEDRDALVATMALLRLLVLGLCWYLVGVTTVGTVARLLRAASLTRLADALTLPLVRRLLQQTFGVVLATTMIAAATGPGVALPAATPAQATTGADDDDAPPDGASVPWWFDALSLPPLPSRSGAGMVRTAPAPVAGADEVTLRGLPAPADAEGLPLPWRIADAGRAPERGDASDSSPPDAVTGDAADTSPPDTVMGQDPSATSARDTVARDVPAEPAWHIVRSGDSLWRIASDRLERWFGRAATDAEIVPYWRAVIESNRERLPDRDDPDLILPGQELLLPPVSAP